MRSFAHFAPFRLAPRWPELGCQVRVRLAGGSSGLLEVRTIAAGALHIALAEPEGLGPVTDPAEPEGLGLEAVPAIEELGTADPVAVPAARPADLERPARHPAPAVHKEPDPA